MLSEKFGITTKAVEDELSSLNDNFLRTRRILKGQLRTVEDIEYSQQHLVPLDKPVSTKVELEDALELLKDLYSKHKRHLVALHRVLEDEMVADTAQVKLPLAAAD
jgi:hypothetical protein